MTVRPALCVSLWFLNNSSCIHSGFFHKLKASLASPLAVTSTHKVAVLSSLDIFPLPFLDTSWGRPPCGAQGKTPEPGGSSVVVAPAGLPVVEKHFISVNVPWAAGVEQALWSFGGTVGRRKVSCWKGGKREPSCHLPRAHDFRSHTRADMVEAHEHSRLWEGLSENLHVPLQGGEPCRVGGQRGDWPERESRKVQVRSGHCKHLGDCGGRQWRWALGPEGSLLRAYGQVWRPD